MRVSFDFDDTLTTRKGRLLLARRLAEGDVVYIITRRSERAKTAVMALAKGYRIPAYRVIFTGGRMKWEEVKRLRIDVHYDNNGRELELIREKTDARGILV